MRDPAGNPMRLRRLRFRFSGLRPAAFFEGSTKAPLFEPERAWREQAPAGGCCRKEEAALEERIG